MVWVCINEDNFQKTQNKLFSLRLCVSALKRTRSTAESMFNQAMAEAVGKLSTSG
jgi:hypothetical protein